MGITLSSCLRFPRTWSEEEGADASVEDVELDEVTVREGSAENPPAAGDSNADRGQADAYHSSSFRYHGEVPDIEHAPAMQVSLKNFKDPSDVEVVGSFCASTVLYPFNIFFCCSESYQVQEKVVPLCGMGRVDVPMDSFHPGYLGWYLT